MSQDLFAAFGSGPGDSTKPQPAGSVSSQIKNGSDIQLAGENAQQIEDDDDFGDFEDAEAPMDQLSQNQSQATIVEPKLHEVPEIAPKQLKPVTKLPFDPKPTKQAVEPSKVGRHPFADHMDVLFAADDEDYDAGKDELDDLANNPEAAMAYSKRVIEEQMAAQAKIQPDTSPLPTGVAEASNTTQHNAKARDPNVLFDAEDVSDGSSEAAGDQDDWGDFEDTVAVIKPTLQLKSLPQSKSSSSKPPVDLLGLDDNFESVSISAIDKESISVPTKYSKSTLEKKISTKTKSQTPVQVDLDEPWDDFETEAPVSKPPAAKEPSSNVKAITLTQPPTNIPPPSMLLSYFGTVLKSLPSPNALEEFVESMIVLAHVLAGRKYRWKRSSILASSMRIGPAAAGGKSGMKLAGVDRSEVAREDREVAEIFSNWRRQVGRLRSAFSTGHSTRHLRLPELQENLPVKTLKALDGGFTAPHECALCGLRREERVAKIDDNVQDSFGEWWMDSISMHTSCGRWWSINEPAMRGR